MTKTQLAILWGLGVLFIVILGTVGILYTQATWTEAPMAMPKATNVASVATPPQVAYRLPETSYTARNLYDQAEQAAKAWQPDAKLVSAAASWSFAGLDGFSRPTDWTFQFYSPATRRIYVTNVAETMVTRIRETLSPYSLRTVDVEQWQVDSHQALNAWLNRGGGAFLKQHAVVDVSIRLAQAPEGVPMWTVLGIDSSGQATQTERIDAQVPNP